MKASRTSFWNAHGVWRVAGTRTSLDSVVIGFRQGQSAEKIQCNFPALSLEQVYGTIAYYLGHRQEVEEYLPQQRAAWEGIALMPTAACRVGLAPPFFLAELAQHLRRLPDQGGTT